MRQDRREAVLRAVACAFYKTFDFHEAVGLLKDVEEVFAGPPPRDESLDIAVIHAEGIMVPWENHICNKADPHYDEYVHYAPVEISK